MKPISIPFITKKAVNTVPWATKVMRLFDALRHQRESYGQAMGQAIECYRPWRPRP